MPQPSRKLSGQQLDNSTTSFKKDADGVLRWDRRTGRARWGPKARNPAFVEAAELIIENGAINRIWDTLADRPAELADDEELFIVGKALRRAVELGRLDANLVAVLLRLLDSPQSLKTETRAPAAHRAIRAAVEANPDVSLGQLERDFGVRAVRRR
jgi:hypothetical protein